MYDYKIPHFNPYLPSIVINIDFLYHFIKSSVKFKMNVRIEMPKSFLKNTISSQWAVLYTEYAEAQLGEFGSVCWGPALAVWMCAEDSPS